MAVSVWLGNRVRAVSTNGLNSGGDNVRKSQGAKFRKIHTGNLRAVVVTVLIAALEVLWVYYRSFGLLLMMIYG